MGICIKNTQQIIDQPRGEMVLIDKHPPHRLTNNIVNTQKQRP